MAQWCLAAAIVGAATAAIEKVAAVHEPDPEANQQREQTHKGFPAVRGEPADQKWNARYHHEDQPRARRTMAHQAK